MIRIDALWLATTPIDMRMGTERLLARVVQVFGSAQAHHGYLFANARGNRNSPANTVLDEVGDQSLISSSRSWACFGSNALGSNEPPHH